MEDIVLLTPSYKGGERDKIIRENLKLIKHPYFTDYAALQKLCLAILRRQKVNYGEDSKKIYGLLFDVAWLWEEYLAGLLKSRDFKHPQNKKGSGWLYMFENKINDTEADKNYSHIYPDFYKPDECVLDAKYKKNNRRQNCPGRSVPTYHLYARYENLHRRYYISPERE